MKYVNSTGSLSLISNLIIRDNIDDLLAFLTCLKVHISRYAQKINKLIKKKYKKINRTNNILKN